MERGHCGVRTLDEGGVFPTRLLPCKEPLESGPPPTPCSVRSLRPDSLPRARYRTDPTSALGFQAPLGGLALDRCGA